VSVQVDESRAARLGLSSASVSRAARLAFSGETVSYLRDGDTEIPLDLRLVAGERSAPGDLPNLYLADGVLLRDVASLSLRPEPARIVRRNAERTLTVSAFTDGSRLPSAVVADVRGAIGRQPLPPGVRVSFGGESEEADKSFGNMLIVFGAAIVVNLVLLVLLFGTPAVVAAVLSAVPLGIIGAVPGLFLARQNFGFMAFLGIAALGGIVTNHTIFLFHYALEERARGIPMAVALVDASRRRLRPILLTVLCRSAPSCRRRFPEASSGPRSTGQSSRACWSPRSSR
jgi:multidrug efflux pump subunit AcrB